MNAQRFTGLWQHTKLVTTVWHWLFLALGYFWFFFWVFFSPLRLASNQEASNA